MGRFSPNKDQQMAIETVEGPLLISAGPGTGKTATLVNRYANMVNNHGISPENILVTTFTEKAAKEIITRISSVIENVDLNDVYIGTFHSICLRIVRDNISFIPTLKKNFTLMDEFDQKYFIYQNFNFGFMELPSFNELPFGKRGIWENVELLTTWLNGLAEEQISPEKLLSDEDSRIVALGEAKKYYDELLVLHNRLDFATLQATAYRLLEENNEILVKYQKLFKYMMIDEYQDTNSIQERLIFLLSQTKNICVVGDDDQSMYRFRGATIRNILEFKSKFPVGVCQEIKLTTNYRSAPEIINFYNKWMDEYAQDFFDWEKFRINKTIVPSGEKCRKKFTPPVLKISGDSLEKWCENIHSFLIRMMKEGYIQNYNQVAFLFRSVTHDQTRFLANYLEENGISIYSPRSKMFFEREEIKIAIGLILNLFADFEEKLFEEDDDWLKGTRRYYEECIEKAYDLMDTDPKLEDWVSCRREELDSLKGNTDYTFTSLLYQLFTFDYFKKILDTDLSSGVSDQRAIRNLATLTNLFAKFESIEKVDVISSEKKSRILNKLFKTYLRFLLKGGMEEYQDESEYAPSGCVSFMTIHQSKGMEFPIVITDSLYDIPIPDRRSLLNDVYDRYSLRKDFEPIDRIKFFDFWRRYYVAYSRAEELLVLTTPLKTAGHRQSPSKYFSTAWNDIADYHDREWDFSEFNFKQVKVSKLRESYAFTSDISKYERCSIEYKMFRELGFSEIRVGSTLFGSLVHQTIEDVHDAILRGENDNITENISNWFEQNYQGLVLTEHSYLAPKAKNAALRYVERYFNNAPELWENIKEFEVQLSHSMKDFILNGQIDMLKGEDGTVEIVDFKTGDKPKSMTDKMLKNYEKQLQIYAYLVEQKYGVEVSKMKLYYMSAIEDPIISFEKNNNQVQSVLNEFSETVKKIENREFNKRTDDKSNCFECDMRYYCKMSNPIK